MEKRVLAHVVGGRGWGTAVTIAVRVLGEGGGVM
jgi:hypothetical protein